MHVPSPVNPGCLFPSHKQALIGLHGAAHQSLQPLLTTALVATSQPHPTPAPYPRYLPCRPVLRSRLHPRHLHRAPSSTWPHHLAIASTRPPCTPTFQRQLQPHLIAPCNYCLSSPAPSSKQLTAHQKLDKDPQASPTVSCCYPHASARYLCYQTAL